MLCPCCWSPLPFLLPISSSNSSRPIFCPLLSLSCGLGYFSTNPIWKQVVSDRERQRLIETNATQTNLGFLALCECLDCADSCVFSYIFFFLFCAWTVSSHGFTVHVLFMHCSCTVHALKNIKNGSHNTIHAFKNYLLQYFQFLVFSFSNNKLNPNGPYKYASLADVVWDIY